MLDKADINSQLRKILVIKLCCLGDVVFLTPALRALRRKFPAASITYLGSSWVKDIVEQTGFVDACLVFDAPYWKGKPLGKISAAVRLLRLLRNGRFDAAMIGHRNRFFSLLCWVCGIPLRVGFANPTNRFLTHPVIFDARMHETDRYLRLAATLGVLPDTRETEIHPDPKERQTIDLLFSHLRLDGNGLVVGILAGGGENPGTKMPIKRWNPDYYAKLCQRILDSSPATILFLGGESDKKVNARIIAELGNFKLRVRDVAGEISLRTLPALLQRCHLVIGGDSGPTHLAAAVGTPTIFLFGPSDPRLVAPEKANCTYLWKRVHCAPCYTPETVMQKRYFDGDSFICWTGTHECLETMSVEEVFASFQKVAARVLSSKQEIDIHRA
jgi:lipopolysaccharide heptosyltransferase II